MRSSGKAKKKTLYGRYDDYDLPDNGIGDPDGRDPSPVRSGSHAQKLVEPDGVSRPSAARAPAARPAGRSSGRPAGSTSAPAAQSRRARERTVREAPKDLRTVSDFAVTRIRSEEDGNLLLVTLEGSTDDGSRVRRDVPITVEQYAALAVKVGPVTGEQADALTQAGSLCLAIRKGIELLGYGDLSARRMVYKLTSRGIGQETAREAAAWLTAHGLIREDDAAYRRAVQDARKLWGPRRIIQDLRAQGYSAEAASAALDALTGADCDPDEPLPPDCVDFEQSCVTVIRKKYGAVPEDRAERQKMVAALMRLGYDTDTIREAASQLLNE